MYDTPRTIEQILTMLADTPPYAMKIIMQAYDYVTG